MTKRMLIDTTHAEETRVVVLDGNRLDDYDVETSSKKQLKGNIYLAKIVRIEPSLQAAFVEYGGNRHGFLAFSEIHPDYYQIPVADRERLLALQEEEARADEARADREDEDGHDDTGPDESGPEESAADEAEPADATSLPAADTAMTVDDDPAAPGSAALEIPSETVQGELDVEPDSDGPDGEPALDEQPDIGGGSGADAARDLGGDNPDASGFQADTMPPDEPAPETVGGESADDGHAQRRTARFLRQYKIQEVMRRRQILLIQVVKEERGNKGAALTTYISLAGRFSVLMPNSLRGGGVSRKITSAADRRRLKEITSELGIPRGMAMIVRTAGAQRPKPEIKRDGEYLLRTWDDIRETTLASTAPCLVYEEASLIKRAIRDVYTRDVEEIVVDGEAGWKGAREFMRTLMPSNANKVNLWRDPAQKLFSHYQVEHHLDAMLQPTVQLRSGGYLVINQTEALVAIDVNSGRSTRERGIEETALRTNMEAADEVARQLRLRDLAGLIVIDFIDMEARRNNAMVERRLKDALRNDRARIQVGSISHFGLMEMSRQRLRPSIAESSFVPCSHCAGSGFMRGTESSALHVLRAIEEEAGRRKAGEILVHAASSVALYVLNNKRAWLAEIESHHHMTVHLAGDDSLIPPAVRIDKIRPYIAPPDAIAAPQPAITRSIPIETFAPDAGADEDWTEEPQADPGASGALPAEAAARPAPEPSAADGEDAERRQKRRRRRRRSGGRREDGTPMPEGAPQPGLEPFGSDEDEQPGEEGDLASPSLQPGETLASPSVFEIGAPNETIAPIVATDAVAPDEAAPADGAGRPRRRRGGGARNRPRPDADAVEADAAPQRQAPRPYSGPTPADPFAGSFDIFEMIERDADETTALVPNPSASAASHATSTPVASAETAQSVDVAPVEPMPFEPAETAPSSSLVAPEAAADADATPAEAAGPVPEALPEAVAAPVPSAMPDSAADAGVEPAAEPAAEAAEEPAAKPARVAKPRKPRASRAKKVAAPVDDAAVEAAAASPIEQQPAAPASAVADVEEPVPADPVPEAPHDAPDTQAADEPAQADGRDQSIVRPVVIGDDTPAPARRTGWWKR